MKSSFSAISTGTERWVLTNRFTWAPTPYPSVPGYQRAGIVVEAGPGVTALREGDRVCVGFAARVWPRQADSVVAFFGAHLAVGINRVDEVYLLPDQVTDEDGSAVVSAQVGWNAAARLRLEPGDAVLVWGDGVIGQLAAQAAAARGASVLLAGHHRERLARASCPTTLTSEPGWQDAISQTFGRAPVAAVIDTVQSARSQMEYLEILSRRPGAQIVFSGFTPGDQWILDGQLQQREVTVHMVSGATPERIRETLRSLERGELSYSRLVTRTVNWSRAPEIYEDLADSSPQELGQLIDWNGAT